MRTFHRILSVLTLLALMSSSALIAAAQDQQDDQQYDAQYDGRQPAQNQPSPDDPPARAARLQFMSGSVSVQPRGTDDWVAGAVNRPLTNSDNIWADKNSRAEISVGTGLIRIDSESSLTLTNIGENTVQLQLHQGVHCVEARRLPLRCRSQCGQDHHHGLARRRRSQWRRSGRAHQSQRASAVQQWDVSYQ